jgi:repressor LexA
MLMESYNYETNPCYQPALNLKNILLIGRIAAGQPLEAISTPEVVNITQLLLGADRYLLEVKGYSMIGDNICDGDLVVCQQCDVVAEGAIAVVLIDDESATLKRVHYDEPRGTITLIPSNPTLLPVEYKAERITIQGLYLGLLRLGYLR